MLPTILFTTLTTGLCVVVFHPVLIWLGREWWFNPAYGYGFAILPLAITVGWLRRKRLQMTPSLHPGALIIAAGLGLFFAANYIWHLPYLAAYMMLLTLGGIIVLLFTLQGLRTLAFPAGILLCVVPLPAAEELSILLQGITVRFSAGLSSLLGLEITRSGNSLTLANSAFYVDAQCSGVNSFFALLALAAVFSFILLRYRPRWKNFTLFLAAIPLAVAGNIIRVTGILLVAGKWGQKTALTFHDFSSPFIFVFVFILLLLCAYIMQMRLRTIKEIRDG